MPPSSVLTTIGLLALAPLASGQASLAHLRAEWLHPHPEGLDRQVWDMMGKSTVLFSSAAPEGPNWTFPSDGTWIADTVSLGNGGTQVLSSWGAYARTTALFSIHDDGGLATPVWTSGDLGFNWRRRVASADEADVHVELHQRYASPGSQARVVDLTVYTSSDASPAWSTTLPLELPALSEAEVVVSADGSRIIAYVSDAASGGAHVTTVTSTVDADGVRTFSLGASGLIPLTSNPSVFCASADGSTVAIGTISRITVADVDTISVLQVLSHFGQPQYGALSLSSDGGRLSFGTMHKLRVFERGADDLYASILELDLQQGQFCLRAVLSPAGDQCTVGLHEFGNSADATITTIDVGTGTKIFERSYSSEGAHQNYVWRLEYSADGSRVAAGLWGDEAGGVPELVVFEPANDEMLLEWDFEGSVLDLDFAGNGHWLSVASKGVHANVLGGGGALSTFQMDVLDVLIQGVPRAGETVLVGTPIRDGKDSALLESGTLAAAPVEDPEILGQVNQGSLFLDPQAMTVHGPVLVDESNVVWWPVTLPAGAGAVGAQLHFQALNVTDALLSGYLSSLTVLPAASAP